MSQFCVVRASKKFGVTTHLINKHVDNGEILEVRRFDILPSMNLQDLIKISHDTLRKMSIELIKQLDDGSSFIAKRISKFSNENWRGKARFLSELEDLKNIPVSLSEQDMAHVIRSTYHPDYPPFIELHGFKFYLRMDDA